MGQSENHDKVNPRFKRRPRPITNRTISLLIFPALEFEQSKLLPWPPALLSPHSSPNDEPIHGVRLPLCHSRSRTRHLRRRLPTLRPLPHWRRRRYPLRSRRTCQGFVVFPCIITFFFSSFCSYIRKFELIRVCCRCWVELRCCLWSIRQRVVLRGGAGCVRSGLLAG